MTSCVTYAVKWNSTYWATYNREIEITSIIAKKSSDSVKNAKYQIIA